MGPSQYILPIIIIRVAVKSSFLGDLMYVSYQLDKGDVQSPTDIEKFIFKCDN